MTFRLRASVVAFCMLALVGSSASAESVLVDKSEIRFVSKQMGVNFEGRFRKWKADVVFRPNNLAASKAEFDIDLSSIDLASEDSESEAKGSVWFNAAKFPTARFVSTSIKNVGGDKYDVAGRLSMKGITKDTVVPIVLKKDASGDRIAEGTFTVKRLDYKIGEGLWGDTDTVANEVVVRVRMSLAPAT
jgi:polyisoprenoid-binding protein YceI